MLGQFDWIQWAVVIGVFLGTTVVAGRLAGPQATIRDYFLGGRTLPWYAVSGSIIATEISAVTLVGVPAIIFAPGGNFTYLQLGLVGATLARVIVAWFLVPVFYEREIFSPYDYVGRRLGQPAKRMVTCLFMLGGMLGQGARVYLAAVVLDLIIGRSLWGALAAGSGVPTLSWSIGLIGLVAVIWTVMGGIRTVIWTDVILFALFTIGAASAVFVVVCSIPGGWSELWRVGNQAGKFKFFDFRMDPTLEFTFWTALIANTWMSVAILGTDQLMAQRMFCCRNRSDARKAILGSVVGQIVTTLVLVLGVGLYVYYQHFPPQGDAAVAIATRTDNVFPVFILTEMSRWKLPISGLVVAGIFAAAISSMDSILAALSQTTIDLLKSASWVTGGPEPNEKNDVRAARFCVVFWGVVLCAMAHVSIAASAKFPLVLKLALSMIGYTGGSLLAVFLLALWGVRGAGKAFLFSAPLSVLTVFSVVWHAGWANIICWIGSGTILALWLLTKGPSHLRQRRFGVQTLALAGQLALIVVLSYRGYFRAETADGKTEFTTLAFPWFIPIGCLVALIFGWLLADHGRTTPEESIALLAKDN